jgi:hypothetical protein
MLAAGCRASRVVAKFPRDEVPPRVEYSDGRYAHTDTDIDARLGFGRPSTKIVFASPSAPTPNARLSPFILNIVTILFA